MHDDTIENGGSQYNISNETIKDVCHTLEKNLLEYASQNINLSRIVKLFLMAESNLRNNAKASYMDELYRQDASKGKTYDAQWNPSYPSHNETNLWNIAAMREVQEHLPSTGNDLSNLFRVLGEHKDPSLGLMLWLFPELATEERLNTVHGIVCKNPRNWMIRDKMLFWLACVQNLNTNRSIVAYVEAQIFGLKLDGSSGAFANVEGKDANGDIISSAIGLLVLVSCAKLKEPNGSTFGAARETANWLVARLKMKQSVDALSQAWSLYALSEFIHLNECLGVAD